MRTQLPVTSTVSLVAVVLLFVAAVPAMPAQANDATIAQMVETIFAQRPADKFVSVVLKDDARRQYLAFHISTYLDVKELRVYIVPFLGANAEGIDAALAKGDHEGAFQKVITDMRLDLGAKYVADVGLNGILDEAVPLGAGSMRDNFHRDQFADHATADVEYRAWLKRGLELTSN
jgi:hypothetical protein